MMNRDLAGMQIELRKSNVKFESDDTGLEIVRCATFSPAFLNR